MRKFDFSNPDKWAFEAACFFGSAKDDDADFWGSVLEELAWEQNAKDDFEFWGYDSARSAAPEDSRFAEKGTCDHCGAWFLYGCAYKNVDSGDVAIVGHICAANYLGLSGHEYSDKRLREAVKRARSRARADAKWNALAPNRREALEFDHYISRDLKRNFRKWGALSLAQWALAKKLPADAKRHAEEVAARPEAKPVPEALLEGRSPFSGKVLMTKYVENMYGSTLKMLFLDDRGFKLWGTVPAALDGGKGDTVKFDAALDAADDDPCFAFFKRPTKAETLEFAPAD